MRTDKLDATGAKPLDIKVISGQIRICKVTALKINKDEYRQALRWYLPKTKKDKRLVQLFKQGSK